MTPKEMEKRGFDDCMAKRSPLYCSPSTALGEAYLNGWQRANAKQIADWDAGIRLAQFNAAMKRIHRECGL